MIAPPPRPSEEARSATAPSYELAHVALRLAVRGRLLSEVTLTDQRSLALALQVAALLAHLEHGGWRWTAAWQDARVSPEGMLQVAPAPGQGRPPELVQVTLRRLLLQLFRGEGAVSGRGVARCAARQLIERWQQTLIPLRPDRAVAELFEAAPFLWEPRFAPARVALVAEHHLGGQSRLWLAGPGAARRRFFALADDRFRLAQLLASSRARDLWEGWRAGDDPRRLAATGRWRRAVVVWSRDPPAADPADLFAYAQCLYALGKYTAALEALKSLSDFESRLLRAWCQTHLGELNAAQGIVRSLADGPPLTAEQTVRTAEVAIRLLAKRGQRDEIREWVARCFVGAHGRSLLHACIVAAGAAWDCEDLAAMERYLERSRAAVADPTLGIAWLHTRGLLSIAKADGEGAVEHISAALQRRRRRLLPAEAARLWNDLAIGRASAGDLAGAERACRHALLLLSDCDGPVRTTLALYNLAMVRLRRGRAAGVESTLEIATAESRRAGNHRGLIRDLELWVRLELTQGRVVAALARCAEAVQCLEEHGVEERRGVFDLLAARAHGWLGRRDRAAAVLVLVPVAAFCELEPEERPAVWALAGLMEEAAAEAAGTPWAALWLELVAGCRPGAEAWQPLAGLEPFRAARLVFDCELALPGAAPPGLVRQAIATLRKAGAEALAERLENRSLSPWIALESYFSQPAATVEAFADLLASAGYGDARLSWARNEREDVLIAGAGGPEMLSAAFESGELALHSPLVDGTLRALFALIRRDLKVWESRSAQPVLTGILGDSPKLRAAIERIDQLAKGELPILILGESGTGKELAARRVHTASRRSAAPFLAVNCAAFSENLIQSDLFGHVQGSFTGADRDRAGVFEAARGGTVFLDEIGDLPLTLQGKLLRVLQEGEIRRVGESFARKVDVRVVAATHRDLEQMVQSGTFRQDLFFRLKGATIFLPPLRDRGEDVLLLADHFVAHRPGPARRLKKSARRRLLAHSWPGNVRELRNVLEVAAALATDGEIDVEHLDLPSAPPAELGGYHERVEEFRKKLIADAVAETRGNRAEAARRLGMSRQALSYLARQLGLS